MNVINAYVFFIGLCIGSFLNVCISRTIKDESVVWPASYCDKCGNRLKSIDLVPVVSYIILRGRCRGCHEKISKEYPLVELLNAFLYLCIYEKAFNNSTKGYSLDIFS